MQTIKLLSKLILSFILIPLVYANEQLTFYGVIPVEQKTIPIYCGDTHEMFQALIKLSNEDPIAVGGVINKESPETLPLAVLTFTYNEYTNRGTFVITIPESNETCLLFHGFDWVFSTDLKRMILEMEVEKVIDEDKEKEEPDNNIKVLPQDINTDLARNKL